MFFRILFAAILIVCISANSFADSITPATECLKPFAECRSGKKLVAECQAGKNNTTSYFRRIFSKKNVGRQAKNAGKLMAAGVIFSAGIGVWNSSVGSYASAGSNKVVNYIPFQTPYKGIYGIPGYPLFVRGTHYTDTHFFSTEVHNAVAYAAMPAANGGNYYAVRGSFIQSARGAILYSEPVFRKTFVGIIKAIEGLRFEFKGHSVRIRYNYEQSTAIDITVSKTGNETFEWVDHIKHEKGEIGED